MLKPVDIYDRLMAGRGDAADPFNCHIVASILALAGAETGGLCAGCGLSGEALSQLVASLFPGADLRGSEFGEDPRLSEEEASLLDLLARFSTSASPLEETLAAMIARRAQRANHLWQDLGLENRGELSRLMELHFAPLAARNRQDMKWKKFFYRMICADTGYSLCTAPSCSECADFDACFGDEAGPSLFAHTRRGAETAL
ncbi:nitrogen fixation protein NifQ [Afifella sp. IM 167]|uniref:nitrogen fixation protein NifQ n=1 Tax=Afifella sp. IM 167 TaxID=2033586 RepID=UPI001CCEFF4F|nr:nitrogen fixation protein NifQ [Afifella sp. IM 167]MBZ8135267.1 hydrogenase [Afifella sp. IM 167]